jgi:hypothetical protein
MQTQDERLFVMITGWILTFYGVTRRNWPGTILAMLGLGLAEAPLLIPEKKRLPV